MLRRWRRLVVLCCPGLLLLVVLVWSLYYQKGTFPTITFASPSTRPTTRVLLLAYYRTGSSFLGEQFNKNSKMFYFFEPLWNYDNAVQKKEGLMYANGTYTNPPKHGKEYEEHIAIINDLLNCRMHAIPLQILTGSRIQTSRNGQQMIESHSFVTWPGRHRKLENSTYYECINKNTGFGHGKCVPIIENVCKQSDVTVVKTIRTRMWQVESLLRENPGLKVVHLLRDPRGQILSAKMTLTEGMVFDPDFFASNICLMMLRDIHARNKLQEMFPRRILEVQYEDFAEYPYETTTRIYDFLGLELPGNLRTNLQRNSRNGGVDTGFMGTSRKDPNATAHAWVLKIDPALAGVVDEACSELYSELGLLKYKHLRKRYDF
ncbi:carbohydrate sulfotransferase 1-like [Lingula anatina]|uniref:Carbohydrate sulfotransferase 1-like n=1 Tax=Lingula anatina TaxID=7574 RepID=A0A1S3JGE0_LINAN|nr:carbohydrate sulfotransferase 1-like [Lingula anatina]|eukprot:XP_013409475.1 carbohydrate sulfotransferase 1-like [Lingula anatina]